MPETVHGITVAQCHACDTFGNAGEAGQASNHPFDQARSQGLADYSAGENKVQWWTSLHAKFEDIIKRVRDWHFTNLRIAIESDCEDAAGNINIPPAQRADFTDFEAASVHEADKEPVADGGGGLNELDGLAWGNDFGEPQWTFWGSEPGSDSESGKFVEHGSNDGDVAGYPGPRCMVTVDVVNEFLNEVLVDVGWPFGAECGMGMIGGKGSERAQDAAVKEQG